MMKKSPHLTKLWMNLLLVLVSLLFMLLESSEGVAVSEVYRMFQLEKNGSPYGSQRVSLNHLATAPERPGSLSRFIAILPLEDFTLEKLEELLFQRSAEALLILLPKNPKELSRELVEKWRTYERELIQRELKAPIYFAFQDETMHSLNEEVKLASTRPEIINFVEFMGSLLGSQDQYQLVVSEADAAPLKGVSLTNFQGWIAGAGGINTEGQQLPTIAIVAHYDTFAVAPGLAFGADSSASAVVAVLELSRMFSKLYDSPKTQGKYNILFVLSSGGVLNFVGTEKWLASADPRILDTIEFALCLDAIGSENGLSLHVSKLPKDENVIRLYNSFNHTAKAMGIPFQVIHKKINISNPDIDWEHEQFSRKRIIGGTLSGLDKIESAFARSNLFDTKVNGNILERNIKFVAESLAKHMFGHSERDFEIFAGSLAVNSQFVQSWMTALTSVSRFAPLIPLDSQVLSGMQRVFEDHVGSVTNQTFELESGYTFFGTPKVSMSAYRVKPFAFDLILALVVSAYLFSLFVVLKGPSEAIKDIKGLFSTKDKKKMFKKKEK
jgi:hypothetical protein